MQRVHLFSVRAEVRGNAAADDSEGAAGDAAGQPRPSVDDNLRLLLPPCGFL